MKIKKNLDTLIVEQLIDEIVEGKWQLGMKISLEEIMDRYEVSRTPVIQALKRLHSSGFLTKSSKGHYFCREFDEEDIRDIISVRLMIETEAVRRIMEKGPGADLEKLQRLADQAGESYAAGNTIDTRRKDLDFHSALVKCSGNKCLAEIYDKVQAQFMLVNYLLASHSALQERIAIDEHLEIMHWLKEGNGDKATEILSNHIGGTYKKIINRYEVAEKEA